MIEEIAQLNSMTLGSPQWAEAVYGSGPSRNPAGRTRPTHRYHASSNEDEKDFVLEGKNEYISYCLLNMLQNAGLVRRFKMQPFQMSEEIHGVNAFPDFMVDLTDGRRFVLEAKAERFIDADEWTHLRKIDNAFRGTSIRYLLWTDKWPLHPCVQHAMRHARRAHNQRYPIQVLQTVQAALRSGSKTIQELRDPKFNCSFDNVLAAVYAGMAHLNFFATITDRTIVSPVRNAQLIDTLFEATVDRSGWNSLPLAGASIAPDSVVAEIQTHT